MLDYAEAGSGDGCLSLTSEAIEIVLLRSKARTEPVTVKIPRADNPGLVAALERWIAIADIKPGEPLFRSIKKGGHIRERLGRRWRVSRAQGADRKLSDELRVHARGGRGGSQEVQRA